MLLLEIANKAAESSGIQLFEKLSEKFFLRLLIDFISVFILIRLIYYPTHRNREFFFTFFMFNLVIFLITFLLNKVEMSLGAAFGLFAVFTMLRYRTEGISMNDMTYLFTVIAIGLINAVSKGSWDELILLNLIILIFTFFLDSRFFMKKEVSKKIHYDNLEMIKPERREELIKELEGQTGFSIHRISIERVDLLTDSADLRIYYFEK
ncbi:MAG: DUF4956 domain-containing protein [Bacteroidetes bacterium]|nr:DUF4956 domain-containing protein [Bacteroidota bacterium]